MSLVHLVTVFGMPESLRYLALQNKVTEVDKILSDCRSDRKDIESDLGIWAEHRPHFLFAFRADVGYVVPVFGLHIFKQLTGAVPLLFYFRQMLELIGELVWWSFAAAESVCKVSHHVVALARVTRGHTNTDQYACRSSDTDTQEMGGRDGYLSSTKAIID